MGDYWKDVRPFIKERSRRNRANNRDEGAKLLTTYGYSFRTNNDGVHLIVDERVDYWPGTGKWNQRKGKATGRGITSLLQFLKSDPPSDPDTASFIRSIAQER